MPIKPSPLTVKGKVEHPLGARALRSWTQSERSAC